MDSPRRPSLAERAQATIDRLSGKEKPAPEAPLPPHAQVEPPEAARMEAAVREADHLPAAAALTGELRDAEHVTPSHTPGHVPENASQWRAKAQVDMEHPAGRDRREPDKATRPPAPQAEKIAEELEPEL